MRSQGGDQLHEISLGPAPPARRSGAPEEIRATFSTDGPLGLMLDTSLCIRQLAVDGLAGQNPEVSAGLTLCSIQGFAAGGCTHAEAIERIKAARRPLTLTFSRSSAARSGERVIGCTCSGARRIGEGGGVPSMKTGAYTGAFMLYQVTVETATGATFEINKRFSDFEALHEAFINPVLSRAFPFGLDKRVSKNDRQVVSARKDELAAYCTAVLQLAARLGSTEVDAAVQRFLRRSGGGYVWAEPPVLLEGTTEAAGVWDVLGQWRQRVGGRVDVGVERGVFDVKYELVFDGAALGGGRRVRFGANGHPETGSVLGCGVWLNVDGGTRCTLELHEIATTDKMGNQTVGIVEGAPRRPDSPPPGAENGAISTGPIDRVVLEYRTYSGQCTCHKIHLPLLFGSIFDVRLRWSR